MDFVGICFACDIEREQHSSLRKLILNPAQKAGIVANEEKCRILVGATGFRGPPPLVKKQYRKGDRAKLRKMKRKPEPDQLAVMFEKVCGQTTQDTTWRAIIPEEWRKYAKGRAAVRDGFRIIGENKDFIITRVKAVADLLMTTAIDGWARAQIEEIHRNLGYLLSCYAPRDILQLEKLKQPESINEQVKILTGFALTDIHHTKPGSSHSTTGIRTA